MGSLLEGLRDTAGFPTNGYGGHGSALHGWLHISADLAIFGAYAAIPVALVYFMYQRRQLQFTPVLRLIAAFILACGFGHLVDALILWHPHYGLLTTSKILTAVILWTTVVALIRILPRALALEHSERRFALAVRGSSDGVWDNDLVSGENFYSERFCELLGYEPEELASRSMPLRALVDDVDGARFEKALSAHLSERVALDVEAQLRTKQGRSRWFRVRGQAVWSRGVPVRIAGSLTDIHVERMAALAVDSMNADLDRRVHERTAELSAMLREREVLVREVHHRVKHNLQVISSLINMQCTRMDVSAGWASLRDCQARVLAIARVHELLYRTSDASRIPLPEYVGSLVAGIEDMAAAAPRVRIETHVDEVSLSVESGVPCGLILNELITNSLKHGFAGDRSGVIRVSVLRSGSSELRLEVKDNGVGLPQDFNLTQCASLGLTIVERLANQLKGRFDLSSGPGTTVSIVFPAPDLTVRSDQYEPAGRLRLAAGQGSV